MEPPGNPPLDIVKILFINYRMKIIKGKLSRFKNNPKQIKKQNINYTKKNKLGKVNLSI